MNERQRKELEKLGTIFLYKKGYDSKGKRLRKELPKKRTYYDEEPPPWEQEKHG